jgi:glycosyltransferase involved in cell wall biosynthesis
VRVAIGAVAGTTGGPATYAVELVRALVETHPQTEFAVITDLPEAFAGVCDTRRVPLGTSWRQPLWDHLGVAGVLRKERFDVYHGTKGVLPRFVRTPAVVTIHDVAVRVMPETFRRAQRAHLAVETPFAVRRAAAVITDSRSTARDLERYYPRSAAKIEVAPLAARPGLRPATDAEITEWRRNNGVDGLAIGYLGTLQPRKNLDLLADAFRRAAGGRRWQLLLAGRARPGYQPDCLAARGGDARIRYLGEIPDRDLPAYLGALACMVSPSSYEGFGLTFIEAMACGCPVVGFANSSIPEVVGDAGVLVAREEAQPLADAIEHVATDLAFATRLAQRGVARAALFTWRNTARKTHAVYARVAEAARTAKRGRS